MKKENRFLQFIKLSMFLLLILIVILFIVILFVKKEEKSDLGVEQEVEINKRIQLVDTYRTFFSVEQMLNLYIQYAEFGNVEAVYNLLDKEYINNNNIVMDNVIDYVSYMKRYNSDSRIRKMYMQEDSQNCIYFINCIVEKDYKGEEFCFILYQDTSSLTYSIEPLDKKQFETIINNHNTEIEKKKIESNKYNKICYISPSEEQIIEKYFTDYIENALYYPQYAYDTIDIEYKNQHFDNVQDFQKYVANNKDIFLSKDSTNMKKPNEFSNMDEYNLYFAKYKSLKIKEYQIKNVNGEKRYIIIDNYGNNYIFYSTSPLQYKVILDTYTVPLEEFKDNYKLASEKEKVILNINRILDAINNKDYKFIYNKLDNTFKQNNYPSLAYLESFINTNLFEINKFDYQKVEENSGLYVAKVTVSDNSGEDTRKVNLNVIMQLKEGTDFVMSFSVE